ncbi:MAG: response regulator [Lyngbya sp. HA4199-MV5]|jgi:CheY-like chemotaxis protein|nr:response regulator [Lyngbya sp. HA4199-MV5]
MDFCRLDLQPTRMKPCILVVDDNDDNLLLVTQILTRSDRTLLTAQSGKTALALAQASPPDLILLDILLPDLSGFDVLHSLRHHAATAHIPVIAVTALARVDDCQKLLQAGCNDCSSKPYLLEDLELAVERCLQRATLACA